MIKNIFCTGKKGVGKSYLLNRLIKAIPGQKEGFCTVPVLDNHDKAIGFGIRDINDKWDSEAPNLIGLKQDTGILAFPETFDEIGTAILEKGLIQKPRLLIMDELGFLERGADLFLKQVEACLDSDIPVLGVLKDYDDPFLNKIKTRKDVLVLEVTTANREQLYEYLKDMLKGLVA